MTSFWQHLREQHPGEFSDDGLVPEGAATPLNQWLSKPFVAPLWQYGFVDVTGADASKFLQGQTTCDFRKITPQQAGRGAYCTPKGRMVASFQVGARSEEQFILRMNRDVVADFCQVLNRYIVFSKAKMRDAGEELVGLGLCADAALVKDVFGHCPQGEQKSTGDADSLLVQLDAEGQRFECWLSHARALALWPTLVENLARAPSPCWELLNIRAGIGEVRAATRELFLPQMLNFQATGAVSFTKGCYTGQEVVARMHYRGKLKRRMYRAALAGPAPAAGTPLYVDEGSQSVGEVVSAVPLDAGHCELLAVMTRDAVAQGGVHPQGASATLDVLDLPYAIADDGD